MKKIYYILATFFYIGRFPLGPGTLASLVSLPLYYFMEKYTILYIIVLALIIFIGVVASYSVAVESGDEDPSYVVIDEVAGMGMALLFAQRSIIYFAAAFILFRALDIFKAPFIRKVEHIGFGIGIMLDDILSGIIAMVIVMVLRRFGII